MRLLMLVFSLLCFTQIQGIEQIECRSSSYMQEKIYLETHQIHIEEGRIAVLIDDQLIEISQLNCDADGLYVILADKIGPAVCLNGHAIWCWQCKGCSVRWCRVGRCKCVAWE